jgi:oligosaccharide repeat unit polymerase
MLLALCAAASLPVAAWGVARGRIFEPLTVVAAAGALMFVARPLQLFVGWRDLYSFFDPPPGSAGLVLLENQEIARWVTERLQEPLQPALTRALAAAAVFMVLFLVGYRLKLGDRFALRFSRLHGPALLDLRLAVGGSLVLGLGAMTAIIARAGGPAASLEKAADQAALSESFVLFLLAGFGVAALLIWAAWRRPRTRPEWVAFSAAVLTVCAFSLVAGSRARVFLTLVALAVIKHYLWRPWRLRHVAAGLLLLLAFASGYVAFRQVADRGSLADAVSRSPEYVLDGRVVLNDITSFDNLLYVTTIYGRDRPHAHGAFLLDGVRSYLPRAVDPAKPDGGDIELRRVVWGEFLGAGRPPTAAGDLYLDFGFVGVVIGALLLGVVGRSLLGLLDGQPEGRTYRVALYAILLIVLYELVVDTFSIALGFLLTLGLPFLVAVHGFGRLRLPSRAAGIR